MKKLYPYIRPLLPYILLGMALKAVGSIADIALPLLLSEMVGRGIATANVTLITRLAVAMFLVAAVSAISTLISHYIASNTSQKVGQNIRDKLYAHLQMLSLEDVENFSAATLTTRVTYDVDRVMQFISMLMRMVVRNLLLAAGGIGMAMYLDPYLSMSLICTMLVILGISCLLYKFTRKLYTKVQHGLDRTSNIVREALSGIKTIKAFDKLSREIGRFTKESATVRDTEIQAGKVSAVLSSAVTLVSNIGLVLILVISSRRVDSGHMEIGGLIAIVSYMNMIVHAMIVLPRIFANYSRASASAERITELFQITPQPAHRQPIPAQSMPSSPAVVFENVHFRYKGGGNFSLEDISFTVEPGTTLGIIGETGSGKTTLVNLLAGLYPLQQGRILIGGKDLRNFDRSELQQKISVAQQQYDIFTATVQNNIILNRPLEKEQLEKAIRQAQLWDFYSALEHGGDTEIHQSGANLSGGQRQRLNIARVFYSDTDIFVFDDVASALDYRTNLRLQEQLKLLHPKKTVITVAQRINAIRYADKILVLDQGCIVGMGTHQQLLENCPVYLAIFNSQKEVIYVAES